MHCQVCNTDVAARIKNVGGVWIGCDRCADLGVFHRPDVYFRKPYWDPNLGRLGKPEEKNGVWVDSRNHKASLMKDKGVHEAGDRKHGSVNVGTRAKKVYQDAQDRRDK